MITTRHVASPCPSCGMKLDACSTLDDQAITPELGDYSMCCYCGHGLQYAEGLRLVLVVDGDIPPDALREIERVRKLTRGMPGPFGKRVRGPQ